MKIKDTKSAKRKPKTRARKRAPPKPRARRATKSEPVDPIEILESIAANRRLRATPRVAAARELLRYRLAMQKAPVPTAVEQKEIRRDTKDDRLARDLNEAALRQMNPRGRA